MKYLSQFLHFDLIGFLKDKTLLSLECSDLVDYNTKEITGSKISAVIYEDRTEYKRADGENTTNVFEKITIKIPGKKLDIPPKTVIQVCEGATGVIFGEYRSNLSITSPNGVMVVNKTASANGNATPRKETSTAATSTKRMAV